MTLPKLNHPTFVTNLPSNQKKITYRQFKVSEEKILLIAKASKEANDIMRAVKQIVQNCVVDAGFNVEDITLFDLEWLFVQMRAVSVSNVSKVSYIDTEDGKTYNFEIDLNKLKVVFPEKIEPRIAITDKVGMILKYPVAALYADDKFLKSPEEDVLFELIVRCIDKIYQDDTIYDARDYKVDELAEWVTDLDMKTSEKIKEFLLNQPKLYHQLNYKNSNGHDRKIELTTLTDFFLFR
jgi:hypothetical protein